MSNKKVGSARSPGARAKFNADLLAIYCACSQYRHVSRDMCHYWQCEGQSMCGCFSFFFIPRICITISVSIQSNKCSRKFSFRNQPGGAPSLDHFSRVPSQGQEFAKYLLSRMPVEPQCCFLGGGLPGQSDLVLVVLPKVYAAITHDTSIVLPFRN